MKKQKMTMQNNNMRPKLLFCEYAKGVGELLRLRMKYYNIETVICPDDLGSIEDALERSDFQAMFIAVPAEAEELCRHIGKIAGEHPEMKIFAAVCCDDQATVSSLYSAGVALCMKMPISFTDLCSMLAEVLSPYGEGLVIKNVSDFLISQNFAPYLPGFRFLCIAVKMALAHPAAIYDAENLIFPYIAEMMLTTPEFVSDSIVKLSDNVIQLKNWHYDGYSGDRLLSGMEMIAASADEFMSTCVNNKPPG